MPKGIYQRNKKPMIDRLMAKVEKHADGCWVWMGAKTPDGYGQIRLGGSERKVERTHRVSYEHFIGPIPEGLLVCHKCDVRHCVNPAHLFLGAHKDNMQDCVKKGRFADNKGDAHGRAKLTEENIHEIRILAQAGKLHQAIATRFGVARCNISRIVSGKTWSHV